MERSRLLPPQHVLKTKGLSIFLEKYKEPFMSYDSAYQAAYRAANKERLREYFKAHYRKNCAAKKALSKIYRDEHPEYYRAYLQRYFQENKLQHYERSRKWDALHPEFKKVRNQRRRARMAAQPCSLTSDNIHALFVIQQGKCYWCRKAYGRKPHLDHVFPIAKGGTHTKDNVVLSCQNCNLRKGAKTPQEFAGRLL